MSKSQLTPYIYFIIIIEIIFKIFHVNKKIIKHTVIYNIDTEDSIIFLDI